MRNLKEIVLGAALIIGISGCADNRTTEEPVDVPSIDMTYPTDRIVPETCHGQYEYFRDGKMVCMNKDGTGLFYSWNEGWELFHTIDKEVMERFYKCRDSLPAGTPEYTYDKEDGVASVMFFSMNPAPFGQTGEQGPGCYLK